MLVQKHLFHTPKLALDVGTSIAVTVGYETYGTLSPARDNAILICHDFAGTSHAAGRLHPDDPAPGWWDALIGPGKPFDTDRYFVIAPDSLCNLHVKDPMVVTTGPASLNPETGKPYGTEFPQITIRDQVRLQRQLVRSLGIERLYCVAGPSMGGMQALEWAVTYPDEVGKVVAAAAAPKCPPIFALAVCQAGIDAIRDDPDWCGGDYYGSDGPVRGLSRAVHLLSTLGRSNAWIDQVWARKTARASAHPWADPEGLYAFQADMAELARRHAETFDANHFIYTARACILHDLGYGNRGLEVAAQKIKADLLLLPVTSDLLFPAELSLPLVNLMRMHGGRAEIVPVDATGGHFAAIYESGRMAEPIARFLSREELH